MFNFKRAFIFLFSISLCLGMFAPLVQADVQPVITEEVIEKYQTGENKPTYGESMISKIILAPINFMVDIFGARDISYLVFQRPELAPKLSAKEGSDYAEEDGVVGSRDVMIYGVFPEKFFEGIAMFYDAFQSLLPIPLVILFVLAGFILILNSVNPENRTTFKDYLIGIIFTIVALRFGPYVWGILFDINYYIVDLVWVTLVDNNIPTGRFLNTLWGDELPISGIKSLGLAVIVFIGWFVTFILNYQYAMRMIVLGVLILMFGIVVLALIFPTRREAFNLWFHEFTSQIFMQSAHALTLGLFFFTRNALPELSFWIILAFLLGLPSIATIVQRFVGNFTGVHVGSGFSGGLGSAMGLYTIANLGKMLAAASGRRAPMAGANTANRAGTVAASTGTASSQTRFPQMASRINPNTTGVLRPTTRSSRAMGIVSGVGGQRESVSQALNRIGRAVNSPMGRTSLLVGGAMTGGAISAMASGNPIPGMAIGGMGVDALMSGDSIKDPMEHSQSADELQAGHPSKLPRQMQAFATPLDQLRFGETISPNQQALSLDPSPAFPSTPEGRESALQKSNENYAFAKQMLRETSANRFNNPTAHRIAQVSALQARSTRNIARDLSQAEKTMATPSGAASLAMTATRNYQEAEQALSQIDKDAHPALYAQQKAIVQNARSVMNEAVSYATEQFPQLLQPENQQLLAQYNEALRSGNVEEIQKYAEAIDHLPNTTQIQSPSTSQMTGTVAESPAVQQVVKKSSHQQVQTQQKSSEYVTAYHQPSKVRSTNSSSNVANSTRNKPLRQEIEQLKTFRRSRGRL